MEVVELPVLKHISLDDEHVEKMKPYMEKNGGNLCAAIKDIINLAGKHSLHQNSSAIDAGLLNWMLEEVEDILVPDKVLDEILDPGLMTSMSKFEKSIRKRLEEFEWDIDIAIKYDSETYPSEILIEMRGASQKTKFLASLLSQYLVKNSLAYIPLEIKFFVQINSCIKIGFFRSNKNDAQMSLISYFGNFNEIMNVIKDRPDFWKEIVHRHLSSNYNMVTVHRNYLEDIFTDKMPAGEIMIETRAKKPLQDIPLKKFLTLMKEVYEASRIVDMVDIDNDTIIVSHYYRNKNAAERLRHGLVMLLEANGHLYDAKATTNQIVLRHRPDVGMKINEMVDHMKTSSSTVYQELMLFMVFLEGLRDMPDIPMSLSVLGRRIGKSLLKEYEKENGIENWDLETFKNAMETIDTRLHRVSEWKVENMDLLYTIRQCSIAETGNTFDRYKCHTIREVFKGVLEQALGNKAEMKINKLISHGDSFCEVSIRML
jgi:predicted hydrocarbon binding protein